MRAWRTACVCLWRACEARICAACGGSDVRVWKRDSSPLHRGFQAEFHAAELLQRTAKPLQDAAKALQCVAKAFLRVAKALQGIAKLFLRTGKPLQRVVKALQGTVEAFRPAVKA